MRKRSAWVVVAAGLSAFSGCNQGGGHGPRSSGAVVGTTVVAGSLVEARHAHSATALADGERVLLAGGATPLAMATRGAEVWEGGHSRPLSLLLGTARAGHHAVLLPDGRVWILGGHDASGQPLRSTELWDPSDERFLPGPDLRRPRDRAALTIVGSMVYLACGRGEDSLEAWGLDLTAGLFMPGLAAGARAGPDLVSAPQDQLLYLQGGRDDQDQASPAVWIDLAQSRSDVIRPQEPFIQDGRAVLASLDGEPPEIYVVGGTFQDKPCTHLHRVRPSDTERVEVRPRPLVLRQRAATLAWRAGILLAGGTADGYAVESIELIDAQASSLAPPLTVARLEPVATALRGGRVLFSGGLGDDGVPVALTELLLPPGANGPQADPLYAQAAADRAARDRLTAEVLRLEGELKRTQDALQVQSTERARVEGERDAAQARVRQLQTDLAQAQAAAAQLQQQLAQAQANAQTSQAQLQQLQQQLAQAVAAASSRQQELGQAQSQLAALQARVGTLEAELAQLRAERDRLAAELAAARAAPPRQVITFGAA